MARLPVPGSDDGQWGTLLNDFLLQAHNSDGSLKDIVAPSRQILAGTGLTGGGDLSANRTLAVDFGAGASQVAAGNHTHTAARQTQTWSWQGDVEVVAGTGRWYNRTGTTVTVHGVWATVGTAPTGASIIVDVHRSGTTLYTTQANRPTIVAGSNDSGLAVPAITTVADGEYLTVDIDQIGSTTPGADLTVGVVYS